MTSYRNQQIRSISATLTQSRGIGTSLFTKRTFSLQPSIHPGVSTAGYTLPSLWAKGSRRCFSGRNDRVLKSVPNSAGIVDDIFAMAMKKLLIKLQSSPLLETARAYNLTFSSNKFVCKSQECAFFGGHPTPAVYKMDLKVAQNSFQHFPRPHVQNSFKLCQSCILSCLSKFSYNKNFTVPFIKYKPYS